MIPQSTHHWQLRGTSLYSIVDSTDDWLARFLAKLLGGILVSGQRLLVLLQVRSIQKCTKAVGVHADIVCMSFKRHRQVFQKDRLFLLRKRWFV